MADRGKNLRFALDHNFPAPVIGAFGSLMPNVELRPVASIDEHFAKLDDWELFVALRRHELHWDGLITNDDELLALEKEMAVLSQTNLTLIIAKGEGHNPIRAVGLLLCHLNHICHQTRPDRAQVWMLRVVQKNYEEPRSYLEKIAEKKKTTVEEIMQAHRLAPNELRRGAL
jgi:hypothetical protein